jgi:hypothetical protein
MDDPQSFLSDWQLQKCHYGHSFDVGTSFGGDPLAVICTHCGKQWMIEPDKNG